MRNISGRGPRGWSDVAPDLGSRSPLDIANLPDLPVDEVTVWEALETRHTDPPPSDAMSSWNLLGLNASWEPPRVSSAHFPWSAELPARTLGKSVRPDEQQTSDPEVISKELDPEEAWQSLNVSELTPTELFPSWDFLNLSEPLTPLDRGRPNHIESVVIHPRECNISSPVPTSRRSGEEFFILPNGVKFIPETFQLWDGAVFRQLSKAESSILELLARNPAQKFRVQDLIPPVSQETSEMAQAREQVFLSIDNLCKALGSKATVRTTRSDGIWRCQLTAVVPQTLKEVPRPRPYGRIVLPNGMEFSPNERQLHSKDGAKKIPVCESSILEKLATAPDQKFSSQDLVCCLPQVTRRYSEKDRWEGVRVRVSHLCRMLGSRQAVVSTFFSGTRYYQLGSWN